MDAERSRAGKGHTGGRADRDGTAFEAETNVSARGQAHARCAWCPAERACPERTAEGPMLRSHGRDGADGTRRPGGGATLAPELGQDARTRTAEPWKAGSGVAV